MLSRKEQSGRALARQLLSLLVLFGLACAAPCADLPAKLPPKLNPIPASPPLVAAANLDHIPLEGLDSLSRTNGLQPGDSVSVLVTFVQKKKQTQWLLYLEAVVPDPAKRAAKPTRFVVNSSFGPPMKFVSKSAPVKMRMLGPFEVTGRKKPAKPEATDAQFSLNEDFLALGLDQAAALLHRWSKTMDFNKTVTSQALAAMNPTAAEQRAVCATFPALMSYFNIVRHTEGLSDLLFKLVDKPSLWSIIRHGGVDMTLTFGDGAAPSLANPADWNLPASAPTYYFPWLLRLNDQPALKVTMVTTSPRSPLLICGGVVGLLIETIGDDETYMTMRVISARSAEHRSARAD